MEYGKATYRQIIDDVLEDINEDEALARKGENSFQNDILKAQQLICQLYAIEEEYLLRLTANVDEYSILDRPAITGVTAASPPVVTASGHGLSNGDVINIRDIQGLTGANGRFKITYISSSSFSLKMFARIDGIAIDPDNSARLIITTDYAHGFTTGQEVDIQDTGIAEIDDIVTHTVTVTGAKTFTIPVTLTSVDYDGGGIVTRNATGSGTYVAGGRYWKENEIPTHINRFLYGSRTWHGLKRRIEFENNGEIVEAENWNWGTLAYGSYYSPHSAVHSTRAGQRYVRFYPTPVEDHYVTLYGLKQILPHQYFSDPVTAAIHLEGWDEAIKFYVKACAYKYIKQRDLAKEEEERFYAYVRQRQIMRQMPHKIRIAYK